MRKRQDNSARALALQISLSIALISVLAVLLAAASFKSAPLTSGLSAAISPEGDNQLAIAGPGSGPPLAPAAAPFTFENTGSLNTARYDHTATLLPNGKVLVAGGLNNGSVFASAELYDPANGSWSATGSLNTARFFHTATLLPNGKVLVAGGSNSSGYLTSAELYDPASGTWTATGSLNMARYQHTATLLPNGKVLVAAGYNFNYNGLMSAELYDPASGTWTATGSLNTARHLHTATLLPNGKVLVVGGSGDNAAPTSAELYDPASGTWTATGSLNTGRREHTATLLPNGKVLVAGGCCPIYLTSAELYDPASGTWTATGSLNTGRSDHTATLLPNGKVLVTGGYNGSVYLTSAELYDPASGNWSATGSLNTARQLHTTTLLTSGKVLVAGGFGNAALTSAELYDPTSGTWTAIGSLNTARSSHTATLLPNAKVLVAGGSNGSVYLTSAQLYDPASGTWTATGSLNTARDRHTATLLPNGKVLVTGGYNGSVYLTSAELYDPASGSWSATGSLNTARYLHRATLLPNGKVLVAGGSDGSDYLTSVQLYDPASGSWTTTGSLNTARISHTATLLPNGKVLVAAGFNPRPGTIFASAELYDPASGTWMATGSLNTARIGHTATLLPNGKVLVAGGYNGGSLFSAELYDPASRTWTATGSLNTARSGQTATLLPNGKVLVAGGYNGGSLFSAELYDPASGTWTATGGLNTAHDGHSATLLPNGKVLVVEGVGNPSPTPTSTPTPTPRPRQALVAEGGGNSGTVMPGSLHPAAGSIGAELYDTGLGFVRPDWQPQIATATSPLITGTSLMLTGSRFQGISQASGGNVQDSSTNYPVVQLRNIDNSQVAFLPVDMVAGWTDTTFTSTPVTSFPPGPALVTVFTNGIPSDSKYLLVTSLSISGSVSYCSGSPRPVPKITLNLTGGSTGSALTNNSGAYSLSPISSGGNYTVTPTPLRNLMPVVDPKPDSGDALQIQAHFQSGGTLLTGCQELAAHVRGNPTVDTGDALAVSRFFNNSVGAGNLTGQWRFVPANRTYMPLTMSLASENYDTYVLGDVTGGVVFPTSAPEAPPEAINGESYARNAVQSELPQVLNSEPVAVVALSEQSVPTAGSNELIVAVTVSNIDPAINGQLQAFQGDLIFDSTVVNFESPPVERAGLTAEGNWSLMANVLGTGKMKTLRISCFSLDGGSLSGEGTLFELRLRLSNSNAAANTMLIWSAEPNNFIFFDANLQRRPPLSAPPCKITWNDATGRR